tara:strand:- start:347 stop:805 length:459 start_codon:yes stop_codon:yes gene_type:complete
MGAKAGIQPHSYYVCFNPRTRDGCEYLDGFKKEGFVVSIHAPVMGANPGTGNGQTGDNVSIHAPVMGANLLCWLPLYRLLRFNPRTRDGCEGNKSALARIINVSIHAPVMGANAHTLSKVGAPIVSIHAPVMGAKDKSESAHKFFKFQSTHP